MLDLFAAARELPEGCDRRGVREPRVTRDGDLSLMGGFGSEEKQVNGITTAQTSQPLAITAQNSSGAGKPTLRPNNNGRSAKPGYFRLRFSKRPHGISGPSWLENSARSAEYING